MEAQSKLTLDASGPYRAARQPAWDERSSTGKPSAARPTQPPTRHHPERAPVLPGRDGAPVRRVHQVAGVNQALAGSGYRSVTIQYPTVDERPLPSSGSAVHRLLDSTYSAMFVVVVVMPEDAAADAACIKADPNGASSALVMVDGSFDPATGVYENKARLFLLRLLDTTQVAIDVGRERMGTDKRPGTIEMSRVGRRLRVSVADQGQRGVVKGDVELGGEAAAYMAHLAQAAATAGIPFRSLPPGTEYAYPVVARLGRARSCERCGEAIAFLDCSPCAGNGGLDPASEEGRMR